MKKQARTARERKAGRPSSADRKGLSPARRPESGRRKPIALPPNNKASATAALVSARVRPGGQQRDFTAEQQQKAYDEAMRLFQAHKFERADELFRKATEGPNRTLAHHAQIHSQICQKRLAPPEPKLKTADDHYNYAVTMMNARRLKEAAEHLEMALHMAPQADHLYYALAATEALQGNPQGAYERLKTAIHLQPRNRILARGDADFAGILEYPPLASLLQLDRGWSPKAS
ncbi:MAG TPA: hypothetical protein VFA54_16030 [Bryobacterales bacterium]|jgi:tetratricopeptide (TPR) repeat protein|nr:hypothetical protein [Bryobacterales bacterium]